MLSKQQEMVDDRDFLASSVTDAQLESMNIKEANFLDSISRGYP
jgi:hypothetical protein